MEDTDKKSFFRKYFTNKYVVVVFVFAIWVTFLTDKNLIDIMELRSDIEQLKEQREYYKQKIKENKEKIHQLKTNKDNLERFAREEYLMKKGNEDIFIIMDKKEQ